MHPLQQPTIGAPPRGPGHDSPLVHVVDDDEGIRESLTFLLETAGFSVCTYPNALALMEVKLPPMGCVLTDFTMPGMDGLQLQAALAAAGCRLPVIVMTANGDVPLAVRAMKAGAVDFLEKPFDDTALLQALHRALARNQGVMAACQQQEQAATRLECLTPREAEVMGLMVRGMSTKAIAQELGASPRTIDVHRARVFEKLRTENLPDLVRLTLLANGRLEE